MATAKRTKRSAYALYVDAAFSADYSATDYQIVGYDSETLSVSLNPNVSSFENVLGETVAIFDGYSPTIDVSQFYHRMKAALEEKILELAMQRASGDECMTSVIEAVYEMPEDTNTPPTLKFAFRENVLCVPTSYGGDRTGFQTPFRVDFSGNRTKGNFDRETKEFTADTNL